MLDDTFLRDDFTSFSQTKITHSRQVNVLPGIQVHSIHNNPIPLECFVQASYCSLKPSCCYHCCPDFCLYRPNIVAIHRRIYSPFNYFVSLKPIFTVQHIISKKTTWSSVIILILGKRNSASQQVWEIFQTRLL